MQQERLLILSDGKPGHLNQSIAFARHLGYAYDVCPVAFQSRWSKAVSYLADRCRLRLAGLFHAEPISDNYHAVISAGSGTYYANRVLAHRLGVKSVAIMLPKGYRYDFDLIVAQQHDDPPLQSNVIKLPINLTYVEPQGLVVPEADQKYISVIIGGDSQRGNLQPERLQNQLQQVFKLFPEHKFWLTTSRRTSRAVETVLREFNWAAAIYFFQQQINPIPDFLAHSDYLFLTADSTSMVSEAVSFGTACVEVLPPAGGLSSEDKFGRMFAALQGADALHLFDGTVAKKQKKIDLAALLREVSL